MTEHEALSGTTAESRAFIAVALPPSVREALAARSAALVQQLPAVRWGRKPENFHLTIRFLGNVPSLQLAPLASGLDSALHDTRAFDIEVRGMGAFPSLRRANTVWAGIDDPSSGLARIFSLVATATKNVGDAPLEERPFRPHVTLGRSKMAIDLSSPLEAFVNVSFGGARVDSVGLYTSRLSREGSTYTLLSRAELSR